MKKKVINLIVALFVIVTGYYVFIEEKNDINMSELMLANIEALSLPETNRKIYNCYSTISSSNTSAATVDVMYCGSCTVQPANYYSVQGLCSK